MVGGCRLLRTSAALALALVALAGCGGDDEEPALTTPTLTVPGEPTETTPTQTAPETSTEPEAPPADTSGGTTVPSPGEPPADSPGSDQPPTPGSPEERFEDFCNANPGACG